MSDINNSHHLFIESVNEENQKKNDISDSIFKFNSKKNLILIAKETLKTKGNKLNKIKIKDNILKTKPQEKSPKNRFISFKKKINEKENINNDLIFSDKEYLNFMLNDLKSISSTIEKKQRFFNQYLSNNSLLRNNQNNFLSYDNKRRNPRKIYNFKQMNESKKNKKNNCNNINLLEQIIGIQDNTEPIYENKVTFTEDNLDFNNLYFDRNTNEIFYKDNKDN